MGSDTVTELSDFTSSVRAERDALALADLPSTIGELVSVAANIHGNRTAIDFFADNEQRTFVELRHDVAATTSALHTIGVRENTHVAVIISNRIEFPITWLAIATLGAIMVPLHTKSRPNELKFFLSDADVEFLIIEDKFLKNFEQIPEHSDQIADENVVVIGDDVDERYSDFFTICDNGDPKFSPRVDIESDHLLNIQYTSGSTGVPKGAMLTHRYWIICGTKVGGLWGRINSILSDHPFFYMDSQWMLVAGLYFGGCVHFSDRMTVTDFMEWIHSYDIELAYLPEPLLKRPEEESDRETKVKVFIAYAFGADQIKEAERRFGTLVREAYGSTEVGSALAVPRKIVDESIFGTCGLPSSLRECRIVDSNGIDVAKGESGELLVKGDGIFLGYYNRPEANKECFVDDWFRTGDLFVQNDHGYYHFVGRLKDMVKRSGENIAAYEVELVLRELDQVEDAAVVPVPDEYRDEEVKAYLKLIDGATIDDLSPSTVIGHCKERLADFKIPRYLEYVKELPYTPSEKVAKMELIKMVDDLRLNSYDAVDKRWRLAG